MKMRMLGALNNRRLAASHGVTVVRALQALDFEFNDGDRIGLIGGNGAGKSTLLRVLAGIYTPSSGTVRVEGRVVALLELGLGMDDNLTGYENIRLRGMLLGMSPEEIKAKTPGIAAFTDLDNYLHLPIRTYSSGMRVRLAFAISTAVEADLLLLDEVVGVGDAAFMKKANERLQDFHDRAKIVFIASHANDTIRTMCNKALWLDGGQLRMAGPVEDVMQAYEQA
ncbi:ABC transporter ATP-binding protein [Castellaniella defragrans]|uniref:ABC transporter ATP-binding protein n=1 Tax=Castellaniella defragrans TaxID=75697 RepID=UPI002AFFA382|nr:ABC transporter ATP-binding protein [Castellaniella defragrans]